MDRRALLLLLVSSAAYADKKTQQMIPGYQREAQSCAIQVSGLEKVLAGATALAPTLSGDDKEALDKDLVTLTLGLTTVKGYCTAVTELVAFLDAAKDATYKSVERELDTRDNVVRKLRKNSKSMIEALAPITRTWIGRIAQNQIVKPDEAKPKPTKLPSGRSVVLPKLFKGDWQAVGDKTTDTILYNRDDGQANVWVSWSKGDNCDLEKKRRDPRPLADAITKADGLVVAWHGVEPRDMSPGYSESLCVTANGGTSLAVVQQVPKADNKFPAMRRLALDLARAQAADAKTR